MHFTPKNNPLKYANLYDFVSCYNRANRQQREQTRRFKPFSYNEITARDRTDMDITWLKDKYSIERDNLADPETIAGDIVQNLKAALDGFDKIYRNLKGG
jgi:type I restriction enzyme M protein